jgi:hypothetical protein
MSKNALRQFDQPTIESLRYYVYALVDPRDAKVFYIGKGQGTRVFSHFAEVEQMITGRQRATAKLRRIQEIWEQDLDVDWYIIRSALQSEAAALDVEAAIIDALEISQNGPALNDIAGQESQSRGILAADEVSALAAQPVRPHGTYGKVFIFPINKATRDGRAPYEATRRAWEVNAKFVDDESLAVGIANGISRGAFTIERWSEPDLTTNLREFDGVLLPNDHELSQKNWTAVIGKARGFWQRGGYLIIEIRNAKYRFLRGCSNREWHAFES